MSFFIVAFSALFSALLSAPFFRRFSDVTRYSPKPRSLGVLSVDLVYTVLNFITFFWSIIWSFFRKDQISTHKLQELGGRWGEVEIEKGPMDLFPTEPTDAGRQSGIRRASGSCSS